MSSTEQAEEIFAAEGFSLQEREDGTFAFFDEEDELVALGKSVLEALQALTQRALGSIPQCLKKAFRHNGLPYQVSSKDCLKCLRY